MPPLFQALNYTSGNPVQPVKPDRHLPEKPQFVKSRDYETFQRDFKAVHCWFNERHTTYRGWVDANVNKKDGRLEINNHFYESMEAILQQVERDVDETTYHCFLEPLARLYEVLANNPVSRENARNALCHGTEVARSLSQFRDAHYDVFGSERENLAVRPQLCQDSADTGSTATSPPPVH